MIAIAIFVFNAASLAHSIDIPQGQYGVSQSSAVWSTAPPNGQQKIAGIHQASVVSMRLLAGPKKGVPLIVWTDANGLGGSAGGSIRDGAYYKTEHQCKNGQRLTINAVSKDGRAGTVAVNGKEYKLVDGALFLISTTSPTLRIQQIKVDAATFPFGHNHQRLMDYAQKNKAIRTFWAGDK